MGSTWSSPMPRSQPFASFARSRNNRASLPQLSAYIRQDERNSLSRKNLHVVRGILIRQEKTVPLDKITDMAMFHGPIMRHFELRGLSVETADSSSRVRASRIGESYVDGVHVAVNSFDSLPPAARHPLNDRDLSMVGAVVMDDRVKAPHRQSSQHRWSNRHPSIAPPRDRHRTAVSCRPARSEPWKP